MLTKSWRRSGKAGLIAGVLLWSSLGLAQAQNLPVEKLTGGHGLPADASQRVYVMDSVFQHLTDSRLNIFDGADGKFLGMIPTAFNGHAQLSKDGRDIYIATTYFERVTRGKRTDVIEVWDGSTLAFKKEIIVPPKRAGALNYDGLFRKTSDGRFVLLQNASPAASVSIVDMQKNEFVQEITASAGCWSVIPLPNKPRSFASICGDGALLTMNLGEDGKLASQHRSKVMFSVPDDPIFITPGILPDSLRFISFYGNVYTVDLRGPEMTFEPVWSLLDDADRKGGWVPGGYNLMAVEPHSKRMYVLMHPEGKEGSHKNPAAEIWVYDLQTKKRLARVPGLDVLSMTVAQGKTPRLLTLDGGNVNIYDIRAAEPKLLRTIKGAGEAALQVMAQPYAGAKND